ncbi:MFS transporter [Arthrobacter sp. Sa2BUA2]|uniref:MFS transporter n=1 Tax=Arthrobacter pullicola TaxID=2762224 RepID=A0ABR8YIH8_9MICC|nr:MFS transporter [Arthrobacter pullicola]MBD8043931.1 MFS transporter [Arthrobacter pullicola]
MNRAAATEPRPAHPRLTDALRGQPKTVWVTAFAAVIAFMGIGLVDPILNTITEELGASPTQTTLLFGSYLGVQVVAMLLTGVMSYRFGAKRTLITGLVLIVLAAGACALVNSIEALVWLRALWGLGNAFFIATALSVIVGAAAGGQAGAILLYEAALGVGLAVGPLLGAALGTLSWRGPFAGTAVLMAVGVILCATMLAGDKGKAERQRIRLIDPILALRNRNLLVTSLGSAFYTAAFFAIIAWAPFVLEEGAFYVGFVFFGWGLCVAVSGVVLAPKMACWFGERGGAVIAVLLYALVLLAMAFGNKTVVVIGIIVSGIFSGILNTLLTGTAMSSGKAPRAVNSAGYNFLRWFGGAVSAVLVGHVAGWLGLRAPFWVGAVCCAAAAALLLLRQEAGDPDPHTVPAEAAAIGAE